MLVDMDDTVINSLSNAIFDFKTADDFVLWWRMNALGKDENKGQDFS